MTRERFAWPNLPGPVLVALARYFGLHRREAAIELRRRYGSRPTVDFVRDAWPALRDGWLARDRDHRSAVVRDLRTRRLGRWEEEPHSTSDEIDYLRSCRNTIGLRETVLPRFLELGASSSPTRTVVHGQDSAEELAVRVLSTLRRATGERSLEPDADGDVGIRYGSAMVFVRIEGDPPVLHLWAPVLSDVGTTAGLDEELNRRNVETAFARLLHVNGTVIAAMELFGVPYQPAHLLAGCELVGELADDVDDELAARFGGRTFFGEKVVRHPLEQAGYL